MLKFPGVGWGGVGEINWGFGTGMCTMRYMK